MQTQHIIVMAVLAACIIYLAYRVAYVFRHKNDPCYGCQLKDVCQKKAISQRQNTPGRDRCGSPCSDYAHSDNNDTGRHDTPLHDHRTQK